MYRMPSLLAHALKQEISLPVAHLLVLVHTAHQLFKLAPGRGLYDGLKRLDKRFSSSLGQGPRLPTESTSCAISLTVCSARTRFLLLGLTPRWGPT
jgi:hypothetical protein